MIKNKLLVILADKDINMKDFAEKAGLRYATLWAFAKNKTQAADYGMLDKICKILDVTPGDILKYVPDEEDINQE